MNETVRPAPAPEEAAAIVAALETISERSEGDANPKRQRWRLAGLMGSPPPERLALDGSLWSYSSWEGRG